MYLGWRDLSVSPGASMVSAMFGLKVAVTLLLMGSIPMWIRLVDASSIVIGFIRLSFAVVLTAAVLRPPWSPLAPAKVPTGSRGSPRTILLIIGALFFAHWVTYFESIQRSSATLGILALSTYGIHVTWLGALFSDRRPRGRDWLAVLVSAGGAWSCLPAPDTETGAFVGFLLGMLSGLFYAALPLLHQRIQHVPLPTRGLGQFLVAWLLFLPLAPFQEWSLDGPSWGALAVLGIVCTFVAHNFWISITTAVRPATSGLLYYLAIPVTMVLETVVLEQQPTAAQMGGAALIIAGNASVLLSRPRPGPGLGAKT